MCKKRNVLGLSALAVVLTCAGSGVKAPDAPLAEKPDYGIEPAGWRVAPEIEAELERMRRSDSYRPHRDSTRIFVRTQLKYGLQRDDYLHRWYDRPLMGDVRYAEKADGHYINIESWRRMSEMAKLCGHGFSAFTISSGRDDILSRSLLPGAECEVLIEIVGDCTFEGGKKPDLEGCLKRIEEALRQPNAFRIDGKVVITSYPRIRLDAMGFYADLRKEIARRWGDKVALMPYFTPFPHEMRTVFDKKELERTKDEIRQALRIVDGLCLAPHPVLIFNRRSNPRFAVEVVVPIVHSVLSEPEFRNKLLGVTAGCGHENCYRWNYAQDCTGTRMLRDNYEFVTALKPDFVNSCEWDEENENTHHRPTIAQGFVASRILRYHSAMFEKRRPEVWPGDDTSIPNLVMCYRKSLLAGEPIEVEVLNIPDGTFRGRDFVVAMKWKNSSGKVVKEYPPRKIPADELRAAWFVTPATELLSEPLLYPELTVWHDGKRRTFGDGFWPLSLKVNRTVDFRWVKQALREKTPGVRSGLVVGPVEKDGTVEVTGFVDSPEDLRSVEVLDGPDTVYLFDPASPVRDGDGDLSVRIAWQGLRWRHPEEVTGSIRLEGAPGARLTADRNNNAFVKGREIRFVKAQIGAGPHGAYADIPREEIQTAEFAVDIPPFFVGRVKAADLLAKDIVSMPAEAGMNLVFRRWLSARRLLPPCGGKTARFSFRMKPSTPDSVLRIQAVDERFRVHYGKAVSFFRPTGRTVEISAFERDTEKVTRVSVDAGRMLLHDFVFSPERGGIITTREGGLGQWGILCGYTPLVCGYGGAETASGNVALECGLNANMMGWPKTVPRFVPGQDGSWALSFTNCSFVTLPQQVVPEYCGFKLEMEVNPNEVIRRQGLFTTGHAYFRLGIEKGRVFANFCLRNYYMHPEKRAEQTVRGPEIKAGRWSRICVVWNRTTCRIDVDGVRGEPVRFSGDLFYPRHSALGFHSGNDTFYNGMIRSFRVSCDMKGE